MLITSPYGALAYAPAHPDHPTNPPPAILSADGMCCFGKEQ